jgi:hypothetical protein
LEEDHGPKLTPSEKLERLYAKKKKKPKSKKVEA